MEDPMEFVKKLREKLTGSSEPAGVTDQGPDPEATIPRALRQRKAAPPVEVEPLSFKEEDRGDNFLRVARNMLQTLAILAAAVIAVLAWIGKLPTGDAAVYEATVVLFGALLLAIVTSHEKWEAFLYIVIVAGFVWYPIMERDWGLGWWAPAAWAVLWLLVIAPVNLGQALGPLMVTIGGSKKV